MKTVKLYDTLPREVTFTAQVLEVTAEEGGDKAEVILDRTLFFPEEGGQSCDTGVLGGLAVTDVQIGEDGVIRHTVKAESGGSEAALRPGMTVSGTIDWDRRFANMQNHTGEHILSGLIHSQYGFDNIGFHLSEHTVTLDVNGQLDEAQILELEKEANEVVFRNLPVTAAYPPAEVLAAAEYRSKKEIDGPVRLVTIEGVDCCACCAPHVARTGEIGLIKIVRVTRYKGGMRLQILCGRRAVSEMQDRQIRLEEISHLTNRPQEKAEEAVRELLEEIGRLRQERRDLETRLALERVKQADPLAENVWLFAAEMDPLVQRNLVNRLCEEHPGYCGMFCGTPEEGFKFIIGSGTKRGDARRICALLREKCAARGGGKPEMVQGTAYGSREEIMDALPQG